MDSYDSVQGQVTRFREHGKESSVCIKRGDFLTCWVAVNFSRRIMETGVYFLFLGRTSSHFLFRNAHSLSDYD